MVNSVQAAREPELDQITLERARRGDKRARIALVRCYQRPVAALLSRMLRRGGQLDRALVEDLAQDTFVRVLDALPRFDLGREERLSSWILTIAARRAIDELRRRRPEPMAPEFLECREGVGPPTDGPTARLRLAAMLDQAVADLPPEFRGAFVLREFHELSYAEIAERLQLDLGTVKSRIARARGRLRAQLEEVYRAEKR